MNFLKLAKIWKNMSLIDFNEVEKFTELPFWNKFPTFGGKGSKVLFSDESLISLRVGDDRSINKIDNMAL